MTLVTFIFLGANKLLHSQIFLLDNLALGTSNKQHSELLRVKLFDQDSMRRMKTMATDVGKPVTSYSGTSVSAGHISW